MGYKLMTKIYQCGSSCVIQFGTLYNPTTQEETDPGQLQVLNNGYAVYTICTDGTRLTAKGERL